MRSLLQFNIVNNLGKPPAQTTKPFNLKLSNSRAESVPGFFYFDPQSSPFGLDFFVPYIVAVALMGEPCLGGSLGSWLTSHYSSRQSLGEDDAPDPGFPLFLPHQSSPTPLPSFVIVFFVLLLRAYLEHLTQNQSN
jgi:hypothetical protein